MILLVMCFLMIMQLPVFLLINIDLIRCLRNAIAAVSLCSMMSSVEGCVVFLLVIIVLVLLNMSLVVCILVKTSLFIHIVLIMNLLVVV